MSPSLEHDPRKPATFWDHALGRNSARCECVRQGSAAMSWRFPEVPSGSLTADCDRFVGAVKIEEPNFAEPRVHENIGGVSARREREILPCAILNASIMAFAIPARRFPVCRIDGADRRPSAEDACAHVRPRLARRSYNFRAWVLSTKDSWMTVRRKVVSLTRLTAMTTSAPSARQRVTGMGLTRARSNRPARRPGG